MQLGFLKPTEQDRESVLEKVKAIKAKVLELEADMKDLNAFLEQKGLAISGPDVVKYRNILTGVSAAAWQMNLIRFNCQIKSRIISLDWF